MEHDIPPIDKGSGGLVRLLGIFVVIQVTIVLFFVFVVAFMTATSGVPVTG